MVWLKDFAARFHRMPPASKYVVGTAGLAVFVFLPVVITGGYANKPADSLTPMQLEREAARQRAASIRRQQAGKPQANYFEGYPCTVDCSGHEAGYEWADGHLIDDFDDCKGNSKSFIEGCWAYIDDQLEREADHAAEEW